MRDRGEEEKNEISSNTHIKKIIIKWKRIKDSKLDKEEDKN